MRRWISKILLGATGLVGSAVTGAIFFASAGRWDLPMGWATLGVLAAAGLGMAKMDPELFREREIPGPGSQDRALLLWGRLLALGALVIAGLDVGRFHWSDTVPPVVQILALAVFGLGLGLATWAMVVNRFFSSVIRFQEERGHHLVTDGPYRCVRHPGYAGMFFGLPCLGLALGSWWSIAPLLVFDALLLRRTRLEDRFLHEKLEGYADYARRIRYRLVPRVW